MIHDYRALGQPTDRSCDVAIVGSGPAGLAIALELARTNVRTVVLESGGDRHDPSVESLSDIENVGQRRAHPNATRRRLFGGTSVAWSGRCVPLSTLDFQTRDWVPHSGWPIARADLDAYWDRAGRLLGVGPGVYDDRVWALLDSSPPERAWDGSRFVTEVFQASQATSAPSRLVPYVDPGTDISLAALKHSGAPEAADIGEVARPVLQASINVDVWLNAHVLEVGTEAGGTLATGVRIRRDDGSVAHLRAKRVVLACGGIDNARLLLLSGSAEAGGLGNAHDQVGRYLQDHHYCAIASIEGRPATALRRRLASRWLDQGGRRFGYLTGLSLAPQQQREHGLLRAALYPFEHAAQPAPISRIGRAARQVRHGAIDRHVLSDIGSALLRPFALTRDVADRYWWRRPPLARLSRLDIGCNVEQRPDPDSRVSLGRALDAFGQPKARVDWRIHDEERRTYQACARLFEQECRRLGLDVPAPTPWLMDDSVDWSAFVNDMAHPMCSTRMAADPRRGVVDANCAVHGVQNLYVAGSSVFSTGGTANPTLTVVALALRLADHLRHGLQPAPRSMPAGAAGDPARAATDQNLADRPVRVAFLGAGHRIKTIYAPVTKALAHCIEVVGFTSRDATRAAAFANDTGWRHFDSLQALQNEAHPEALIVAVSDSVNASVVMDAVRQGVPLLAETPLAWDEYTGRRVLKAARAAGCALGIAEQTPFLPREQLRRMTGDLGALGRRVAAVNGHATFDYHGIAQVRAALGYERVATSAAAARFAFGKTGQIGVDESCPPSLGWDEDWLRGHVRYSDGSVLIHDYSSGYAVLPTRPAGSVRVYGECGTEVDDLLLLVDRRTGLATRHPIQRVEHAFGTEGRVLDRLTVDLPGYGEVVWRNPFTAFPLSDEQIAVASLVAALCRVVRDGAAPLYSAREALEDVMFLRALRYSSQDGGRPVRLPLSATRHRARAATFRLLQKLRARS